MQVKKFEARSMKEALQMVKSELGPDAIILSVRDNNKSFGLVGEGSVEITAAVSEATLRKKQFVESRMREQDQQKFKSSSARSQKDVITKVVNQYTEKNAPRPAITSTRYIEIDNDVMQELGGGYSRQSPAAPIQASSSATDYANLRIKNAAQRAFEALQAAAPQMTKSQTTAPAQKIPAQDQTQITALKGEIETLKKVIQNFQQVPQTFTGQHPGADFGVPYDLSFMFEKLVDIGISKENATEILNLAQEDMPPLKMKNKALVDAWVAKHILTATQISEDKPAHKVHLFVGGSGTGKTAALVKMASHLLITEGKKVAILSADTIKVGAIDQLRIFSQILNVPFGIIRDQNDWENAIRQLHLVDYVLVDYPGLSLKNIEEITMMKRILPHNFNQYTTHFVASSGAKDADLLELGKRYKVIGFDDVIFNKLDESSQPGSIYNFMKSFHVPLHSFGVGSRIPEDFERATKERVLDLIFKITKLRKVGDA